MEARHISQPSVSFTVGNAAGIKLDCKIFLIVAQILSPCSFFGSRNILPIRSSCLYSAIALAADSLSSCLDLTKTMGLGVWELNHPSGTNHSLGGAESEGLTADL